MTEIIYLIIKENVKMNFKLRYLLICLLHLGSLKMSMAYLEYDGWVNIELQHAVNPSNPDSFLYRANITIPSLNSGLSNIVQKSLSQTELDGLKLLASRNGYYRLKAVVEYPNGAKRTFLTGNKVCSLLNVHLNDELWISIDGNGYVNAITLSTSEGNFSDCASFDFSSLQAKEFNTEVLIKHTELAPVPDTASFIQKIEREREARERGETKDTRGFLAKYWMYIVPVVLLVFISGATNPEQK